MTKRVDSMPPIIQDLAIKLADASSQEWARENACIQMENIAEFCFAEARRFRKKQTFRRVKK